MICILALYKPIKQAGKIRLKVSSENLRKGKEITSKIELKQDIVA
jgi:hypothetical protein